MSRFACTVITLLAWASPMTASHADNLRVADLAKLSEPISRDEEVSRITVTDEDAYTLIGYHFLNAPQADGKPPLHVLAAEREFKSDFTSTFDYQIENPDELFTPDETVVRTRTTPTLDAVRDSVLLVFDHNGNEIRPFGGNNYINFGYLFDFNTDGILDRADSTNYGLRNAQKHNVQVFDLKSVEAKPRSLLRVVFNFHPRSADEANEWTFECFDENNDGIPEIAFGPEAGENKIGKREIIFRFDKSTGAYTAGELPRDAHVRVLSADDDLETLAEAGGLGYPLINAKTGQAPAPGAKGSYEFRSLKELPIEKFTAFFQGKSRRSVFDGAEGSFPNRLPENLLGMSSKEAAIAIADANRTASHRAGYQLAIDDRDGIAPPVSGWIHYTWESSGCYSSSSTSHAIRFGVPDPMLIVYGDNHIGYVGRNPWADQPAHTASLIKLSENEARFLADTLFWLDRIRSRALPGVARSNSFSGTSADGHASIGLFPDGAAPRLLASGTAWAMQSISGSWDADYAPSTCVNLAGLLLNTAIPELLGDRWVTTRDITRQSLVTPTGERLEPRVNDEERKRLASIFTDILDRHFLQPIPAAILHPLCVAAGAEALVSLLPSLEKLHISLPAPDGDEKEYQALRNRFAHDHFGTPLADDPSEHKDDHARMLALRDKLRHHPSHVLRGPLESTIPRLRLAADPAHLSQAITDETPEKAWALTLLRRTDPAAWAGFVAAEFQKSKDPDRAEILNTIAAGHAPAAAEIIRNLSPQESTGLVLEIARFHQKHDPQQLPLDIPRILKIIRDPNAEFYLRIAAIEFLGEIALPDESLAEFRRLLVSEIRNPVKGTETWMGGSLEAAVSAISKLPDPSRHMQLIMETPGIRKEAFWSGFKALTIMSAKHPGRERILADFLRSQFTESRGMMNGVFMKALAADLRSLAPEIAAFASTSADVEDGDGADYSGGNFQSPVGHRYHIAREITALWSEPDPATLAKMWIAFASAHPHEFDGENSPPLRRLAENHLQALPVSDRKAAIEGISDRIPVADHYSGTLAWLTSISQ